jgi:hypothetical protein
MRVSAVTWRVPNLLAALPLDLVQPDFVRVVLAHAERVGGEEGFRDVLFALSCRRR